MNLSPGLILGKIVKGHLICSVCSECGFIQTSCFQGLRSSLLAQIHSIPGDIMEELKLRLQLKDRLLKEVLADRTHQAQQHEEQVQDLLRTINSKDQYIQVGRSSQAVKVGRCLSEIPTRFLPAGVGDSAESSHC